MKINKLKREEMIYDSCEMGSRFRNFGIVRGFSSNGLLAPFSPLLKQANRFRERKAVNCECGPTRFLNADSPEEVSASGKGTEVIIPILTFIIRILTLDIPAHLETTCIGRFPRWGSFCTSRRRHYH